MSGITPLQPEQIVKWTEMKYTTLNQDEIDMILELDRRYRISMGREMERDAKRKASDRPNKTQYGEMGN